MMVEDFVSSIENPVIWSHNETIDIDDLRVFVNTQIQNLREYLGRDFGVYYHRDDKRLRGVAPQDCKLLAHDMVDFLMRDASHPISVRKQCVEDSVRHMHHIITAGRSFFVTDDGELKTTVFANHFIKGCQENLTVFDFIEGRIQHHSNTSKKPKI